MGHDREREDQMRMGGTMGTPYLLYKATSSNRQTYTQETPIQIRSKPSNKGSGWATSEG